MDILLNTIPKSKPRGPDKSNSAATGVSIPITRADNIFRLIYVEIAPARSRMRNSVAMGPIEPPMILLRKYNFDSNAKCECVVSSKIKLNVGINPITNPAATPAVILASRFNECLRSGLKSTIGQGVPDIYSCKIII
jgi:hypothetical protein